MKRRITLADIEQQVALLNTITGSPMTPWSKLETPEGGHTMSANIGNYHVSQQYGGVCIHRMHSAGGGVSTPIFYGHLPKRDAFNRLVAFIQGVSIHSWDALSHSAS